MKQLFILEDELTLSRGLARAARLNGWQTHAAMTLAEMGDIAERESDASPLRCGIFDLDLPDGHGALLANRLIAAGKLDYVVFFTGSADMAAKKAASMLGPVVPKQAGLKAALAQLQSLLATADKPFLTRSREFNAQPAPPFAAKKHSA